MTTNTNRPYAIDDSNGNQITAGLPAHTARATAQRLADERGKPVSLYPTPAQLDADGDPVDESVEIAPSPRTVYRIEASFERDGQIIDCTQAEVLGDAHGVDYATREEAEAVAEDMQREVADYDLDPSTTYSVVERKATNAKA